MIVKRGQSYGVRVYVAGRQTWVGSYPSLREARAAERDALTRRQRPREETCDAFAARWVEDYPREAAATRRHYGYALGQFASDFAGIRLGDITRASARAWALRQPRGNVQVVRAMFGDAMRDDLCDLNPFSELRLEQSRGRRDLVALTEPELHELADIALAVHGDYGPTFRAMILFAAYVGLRGGELFALERDDISETQVHIRRSLDGTGQIKAPKNGKPRTVILPPPARDALVSMPRRLDTQTVFTTKRGRRFAKPALHFVWSPVRAAYGRPAMAFHELRHFCATHLLELGCSHADVAVQLGHTDGGKLVMSTYGHPSEVGARERLYCAFQPQVTPLRVADRSQASAEGA